MVYFSAVSWVTEAREKKTPGVPAPSWAAVLQLPVALSNVRKHLLLLERSQVHGVGKAKLELNPLSLPLCPQAELQSLAEVPRHQQTR